MQAVSDLPAATAMERPATRSFAGSLGFRVVLPLATMLVVGAVALLVLFTPFWIHTAIDLAGGPALLGLTPAQAHDYSDRTVSHLLLGPASFDFALPDGTPFYSTDEQAHMRDVRVVLIGFLGLAVISGIALAIALVRSRGDARVRLAIGRGALVLAVGTVVVGAIAFVAFDAMFELFHRVLFPGGNYSFDPASQRLVQLYPLAFWQLTAAALGVLLVVGGTATWLLSRARGSNLS